MYFNLLDFMAASMKDIGSSGILFLGESERESSLGRRDEVLYDFFSASNMNSLL
jgi:hypothetical protein